MTNELMFAKPVRVKETPLERVKRYSKNRVERLKLKRKVKKRVIDRNLISNNTYKGKFTKFGKPKILPYGKLKKRADDTMATWVKKTWGIYCVTPNIGIKCYGYSTDSHLIKRGRNMVRYTEINHAPQCQAHNNHHNRNPEIFTNWWINKYGIEKYNELVVESTKHKDWKRSELLQIISKYEQIPGKPQKETGKDQTGK